ncbi:MAG TPA: hypothetical protein VL992_10505, partial [Tepidisphaeraceae bacterium]|nr:hypothetical protein [Tepidisphaeraceae bacterium]
MTAIATSATPPPRPRIARRNDFLWIAAVAVATVVAYLPIFNAGWIWDDNYYVTNNIHLHTLHGLRELWLRPGAVPQYYPLTHTTFWIEYHLWGLHPLGYHLDNLLLHIANAALIGLLLKRLEVKGYALAAALFALHPVQVESVAWVTERKNVLSTLFYLLALWQALDFWQIDARSPVTAKKYWLCLGLFVCALLSKSVTSVLPAIILILIWWKRGRIRWKDVKWLIPFFVLGAAMGSVTAWMEAHVVGAIGPEWNWPFWQRILIASRAVWFYLGKLFWPHPLSFAYHQWSVAPSDSVYLIALLVVLVIAWRFRPLFVGVLIFLVTLSPALGFVNVYPMRYSFVADHFQYLAAAAPLAVVAALLHRLRWPVGLPILAVLGALTFNQVGPYRNAETLWRNAVAGDDQSFLAHYQLGIALLNRGDRAGAEAELQKSISIDSRFADAWVALATVAEANGNWTKA